MRHSIRCAPNEPFRDVLARVLPDAQAQAQAGEKLGMTQMGVYMALHRKPRGGGETSMEERTFRRLAAAAGYDVVVLLVPNENDAAPE